MLGSPSFKVTIRCERIHSIQRRIGLWHLVALEKQHIGPAWAFCSEGCQYVTSILCGGAYVALSRLVKVVAMPRHQSSDCRNGSGGHMLEFLITAAQLGSLVACVYLAGVITKARHTRGK